MKNKEWKMGKRYLLFFATILFLGVNFIQSVNAEVYCLNVYQQFNTEQEVFYPLDPVWDYHPYGRAILDGTVINGVEGGYFFLFEVGVDDSSSITVSTLPEGLTPLEYYYDGYNEVIYKLPAWKPQLGQAGLYPITLTCSNEFGSQQITFYYNVTPAIPPSLYPLNPHPIYNSSVIVMSNPSTIYNVSVRDNLQINFAGLDRNDFSWREWNYGTTGCFYFENITNEGSSIPLGSNLDCCNMVRPYPQPYELFIDYPETKFYRVNYSFYGFTGFTFLYSTPYDFNMTFNWTPTQADIGTHTATFRVKDKTGLISEPIILTINVLPSDMPVADAGPDQEANENDTVTLDGTRSNDPDNEPLSFLWTQTAGPSVTLSDGTSATPTFTAPKVNKKEILTFQLIVNDGELFSEPDTVDITVEYCSGTLTLRQHIDSNKNFNTLEPAASGVNQGRIFRSSPEFSSLVYVTDSDIIFKDEDPGDFFGEDHYMQANVREALLKLSSLVQDEWDGTLKIRITEAYDSRGEHSYNSTHYEGRAVDLTLAYTSSGALAPDKYGRLAKLAHCAGFDWAWYENAAHVHASMQGFHGNDNAFRLDINSQTLPANQRLYMLVTDPNGNRVGSLKPSNFAQKPALINELSVPNALSSGPFLESMNNVMFAKYVILIPNPISGKYNISVFTGVDPSFELATELISEDGSVETIILDDVVQAEQPKDYFINIDEHEFSEQYTECIAPPSGMISWWPGQNHTYDILTGREGTPFGSSYAPGKVGPAFSFDSNDFIWVDNPTEVCSLEEVTIDAWVKLNSPLPERIERFVTLTGEVAVLRYDGGGPGQLHFYMKFINESGDDIWQHIRVDNILQGDVWQHVAGTYDGSVMRVYADGEEVGNLTVNLAMGYPDFQCAVELSSEAEPMNGSLDEVGIYNRSLTDNEIRAIYKTGELGKCKPECVDTDGDGYGNQGSNLMGCFGSVIQPDNCQDTSNPEQTDSDFSILLSDNFDDNSIAQEWFSFNSTNADFKEYNEKMEINSGGIDTWVGFDEYSSLYTRVEGDFTAIVKVESQGYSNEWAKAGIMVKNNMQEAGSSSGYVFMLVAPETHAFQWDSDSNGYLDAWNQIGWITSEYPVWLRLKKEGMTFSGYYSIIGPNGPWLYVGNITLNNANYEQDVGIAVTAHSYVNTSTVVFDDFSLVAPSDGIGDACDNCVNVFNKMQWDYDEDGLGDECDNCIYDANLGQEDTDLDGAGNICDNCLLVENHDQRNSDYDIKGDLCDICPTSSTDSCQMSETSVKSVNESGGVLVSGLGTAQVDIPADALSDESSFFVTATAGNEPTGSYFSLFENTTGNKAASLIYSFGPEYTFFNQPVKITIRYNDTGIDENTIDIYYFNMMMGAWEWTPQGANCDTFLNECYLNVIHFSDYIVGGAPDEDEDGVSNSEDACPLTPGRIDYQGCPVGDDNLVELHIIDKAKTFCNGAGSCKVAIEGAQVRVFDRNNLDFQAQFTKNPKGTQYPNVFEADIGRVGSCVTDESGKCIAGEEAIGEYLVIVKYTDRATGKIVYTGKPKGLEDFQDTDSDLIPDLAYKDFQIIKTINKDGTVDFKAGNKQTVTGSLLEIIYPQYVIWENNLTLYPFIFTSDSEWTVDVCVYVPTGYEVVDGSCNQVFLAGETKEVVFNVVEVGSPEPDFNIEIKTKHNGKNKKLNLEVPGKRTKKYLEEMEKQDKKKK